MILPHRPILVADDDEDDRLLTLDAFRDSGVFTDLHFVENGEQLLDYLYRRRRYSAMEEEPLPSALLLDLKMPGIDGREALRKIRSEHALDTLPVIIFTTSKSPLDIQLTFEMGASLYITKPSTYRHLVRIVAALTSLDITGLTHSAQEFVFRPM